jgi:hypothetical protein
MRISPAAAAASSREATLTASPVTIRCPKAISPATTGPVLIPIRHSMATPRSARISGSISVSRRLMWTAARQARSASSSCTAGTPKTAITASPMNFSTAPPCDSIASCMTSK